MPPRYTIRTAENEVILRELWGLGWKVLDISRRLSVSSESVYTWLNDLGLRKKRGSWNVPKHRPLIAKKDLVGRKCLKCGGVFPSTWIGNRRCDTCKDLEE